ncbi:HD domain-containing protein [Candidatus Woesearchaeota archaeon]|nr:HD domain-containing protein [Candidatus Woesearchaeota archaeon]
MPIKLYEDFRQAFSFSDVPDLSTEPKKRKVQEKLLEQIVCTAEDNPLVLELLERLKERIGNHYYHSLRVGLMFRDLTFRESSLRECGLRESDLKLNLSSYTLDVAGLLHDYGKTKIPEVILHKKGMLLPQEIEVMQTHNRLAVASPEIRHLDYNFYPHLCAIIINHHPYPRKESIRRYYERRHLLMLSRGGERKGERRKYERRAVNPHILRAGMLLSLADQYDALSSGREYKPPMQGDEVQKKLEKFFQKEKVEYLRENYPTPCIIKN